MIASTASTTTVLVVLLVLIGLAMIAATIWLVVATRRDVPALGPLEVMGDRRFTRAAPEARVATLDGARPPGALPPAPMVPFDSDDDDVAEPGVVAEPVVGAEPPAGEGVEPEVVDGAAVAADLVTVGPGPDAAVAREREVDATTEVAGPSEAEIVEDDDVELDIDERVPAPESS